MDGNDVGLGLKMCREAKQMCALAEAEAACCCHIRKWGSDLLLPLIYPQRTWTLYFFVHIVGWLSYYHYHSTRKWSNNISQNPTFVYQFQAKMMLLLKPTVFDFHFCYWTWEWQNASTLWPITICRGILAASFCNFGWQVQNRHSSWRRICWVRKNSLLHALSNICWLASSQKPAISVN